MNEGLDTTIMFWNFKSGSALYLGEYNPLGDNAQNKRILAVSELSGALRSLPVEVVLHEVHVVQRGVVEFSVVEQRGITGVVCRVCFT